MSVTSSLELITLSDSSMYLMPTPFRRERKHVACACGVAGCGFGPRTLPDLVFSCAAGAGRHGFQNVAALARESGGPSVIAKSGFAAFNTRKFLGRQQNLSRLVCLCVCMFVGGEQLRVCTIDFDVCVEREWVFCILGDDGVSVWFQLSTKLCVFSQQVQKKRAGTTR